MKVLMAEDEQTSRIMLASLLQKWGYEPMVVENGQEALEAFLQDDPPEMALIDWLLPGMEGPDVCRRVREELDESSYYPYIILLTVKDQHESLLEGLESGADDYITKPFDPRELKMRLSVGKRIVELQQELRYKADMDFLTDLMNRRAIMHTLEEEMQESLEKGLPLSVAVLDLDHFKRVNDTLGHSAGDDVLQEAARRIKGVLQKTGGVAGRSGGEEFLLVLPEHDEDRAFESCEKVRLYMAQSPIHTDKGETFVTASIGVAKFHGEASLDSFVNRADMAMYQAKSGGRNKVCRASLAEETTSGHGQGHFRSRKRD